VTFDLYILHVANILKASNIMQQTHAVFGDLSF